MKLVWTGMVLLGVVWGGCGKDSLSEGWRYFSDGDENKARLLFSKVQPAVKAELALGELEYLLSNYGEAEGHFARALTHEKNNPLAHAWYGVVRWKENPGDKTALRAFLQALELAPEGEHIPLIAGTLGDAYETKRLTAGNLDTHSPCFAPDGKSLILTRHQDGSGELFRLDIEANTMEPLLPMPTTNEYGTTFSPDGKRLLFASEQRRTDAAVLNLQASGSTPRSEMFYLLDVGTRQITPLLTAPSPVGNPTFTPDGKSILFEAATEGNLDIWIMAADGSNRRRLTTAKDDEGRPVSTPDGKQILFVQAHEGKFDLMTMNPDGSNIRPVIKTPANEFGGVFSSDGKRFYLVRSEGKGYELFVMDWATRRIRPLSGGLGDSLHPAVSTDGKRLVFASNRNDYLELYLMDLTKPVSSETLKRRIEAHLGDF